MAILLKNATFIDWETLAFYNTDLFVEEGQGKGVEKFESNRQGKDYGACTMIDCSGKLVTRAFAVAHHHVYSALARGMPAPKQKPSNFPEILRYVWWTLDKCLDPESIRYSALVTAMASAKAGSTFVIDHHASPNAIAGSLEIIAEAFNEVGVGHLLCYEVTDRDGADRARAGLEESEAYLEKGQGLVGLHASFTVGDETLYRAVDLMKRTDTGVHIHVAEDLYDQEHCLRHHQKRVIPRLLDAGAMDSPKTILVHGLHLDGQERDMIRRSPCWLVQNMESNLKNKVGFFNGAGLGNNIMLGTDGMHSDMVQSLKAAFFVGQQFDEIDLQKAYQRFRNVHRYISSNGFTGSGENDLVVLDYDHPTEINKENFLGHLLFGLNASHVRDVISGGKCIVRNRRLQTIDQEEVLHKSREAATRLWKRMRQ
ncbi:MAG: amidohydrolase family protein [Bacteroidales bacterium]